LLAGLQDELDKKSIALMEGEDRTYQLYREVNEKLPEIELLIKYFWCD
jgi:hypothetical protein